MVDIPIKADSLPKIVEHKNDTEKLSKNKRISELAQQVNIESICDKILDVKVDLTVKEVLGLDKEVAGRMGDQLKNKAINPDTPLAARVNFGRVDYSRHDLVLIEVKIGKFTTEAFIDSGSEINIISKEMYHKCKDDRGSISPVSLELTEVGGSKKELRKYLKYVKVKCGGVVDTEGAFYVANFDVDFTVLLGRPFQVKNKLCLIETEKDGTCVELHPNKNNYNAVYKMPAISAFKEEGSKLKKVVEIHEDPEEETGCSIRAIPYARELEGFYSGRIDNSTLPTITARVNMIRSSLGPGPPFDSRPMEPELEAVKVSRQKASEKNLFSGQQTPGEKYIAVKGPRGKFLALVDPTWKESCVKDDIIRSWEAIVTMMQEGKKSVSVTLLLDAEPNNIHTAIILYVKLSEQIPADIVLGSDWIGRYVHQEIVQAQCPYLEIRNLITRCQGYAYIINTSTTNKDQEVYQSYKHVKEEVAAVERCHENQDNQMDISLPKAWRRPEPEQFSVEIGAEIIQAVSDVTLDMSLVKLSVMRSSFTNPIIFTGQDALEAVIINERSYTESFSVIYDQNLEPAMVLGRKILAKISKNAVM
ncbi:hypothetical protein C8J56DRAFT_1047887 [Mycena floridula]|nr:hypothetical protein C8J56DRAFT_1047887 [Mycena floridula]